MSMASDINDDPDTLGASVPPGAQHLVHHQICHELFMARAGVTPAQACGVGCSTCGVIDASPARCEQCTGVHTAGQPFTGAAPGMPEAMRCAREAAAQISPAPLTDAQVVAACLAYRHDYGLLLPHARVRIAAECRQWDEALRKARHPLADAFAGAMAALDAPAAPLLRDLGDAVLRAGGADGEGGEP